MNTMTIRLNPGNLQSSEALVAWAERRVQAAMRRFSPRITRVEVHVADLNGPRGGSADLRCAMEARINGRKPLAVEHRAENLYSAIDGAARKLRTAAGRAVDRVKDRAHRITRRAPVPAAAWAAPSQTVGASNPRDLEARQLSDARRANKMGGDAVTVEDSAAAEKMAAPVSGEVRSPVRGICEGAD